MKMTIAAFLLLFSCLLMAGCGQTGPLYLPQDESQEQSGEQPENP